MNIRPLLRGEISSIWQIDRGEIVENVYYMRDGALVLKRDCWDIQGWPPGQRDHQMPLLVDCLDRGGIAWAAFDEGVIVGAAVLESRFIGLRRDTLQLMFLHIGRDHRKQGLGAALFNAAAEHGRRLGAKKLYISATPSENTIKFYLRLGCALTREVDPDLFALEPDDIHLAFEIA